MGRKATERERKIPGASAKRWLDALFSYWQVHGIAEQTMDDWAQAVSKSKATLYAYFQSKEEMVEAALEMKLAELQAFEPPLRNQEAPFHQRYRESLETVTGILGEVSALFLEDLRNEFPKQWDMVQQFLDHVGQVLAEFYQAGMRAQVFRNIHPAILVEGDHLFFQQLTDPVFLKKNHLSLRVALEHYIDHKFNGLLANNRQ